MNTSNKPTLPTPEVPQDLIPPKKTNLLPIIGVGVTIIAVIFLLFSYVLFPLGAKHNAESQAKDLVSNVVNDSLKDTPGVTVDIKVTAKGNNFVSVLGGDSKVKNITVDVKNVNIDGQKISETASSGNNQANALKTAKENEAQAKELLSTLADNVDVVQFKMGKVNATNIPTSNGQTENFSFDFLSSGYSIGKDSYAINLNISKSGLEELQTKAIKIAKAYSLDDPSIASVIPASPIPIKMNGSTITATYNNTDYTFSAEPTQGGKAIKYNVNGSESVQVIPVTPGEPSITVNNISFNEVSGNYEMKLSGNITGVDNNLWQYILDHEEELSDRLEDEPVTPYTGQTPGITPSTGSSNGYAEPPTGATTQSVTPPTGATPETVTSQPYSE